MIIIKKLIIKFRNNNIVILDDNEMITLSELDSIEAFNKIIASL